MPGIENLYYLCARNIKTQHIMRLLSAKRYGVKLKATIQASGKLGFPKATSDILRFSERPYVYFLLDDNEEDLYMVLLAEGNEDAFKVITSSGYYSLNTTSIFNELQYDYKNKTIIFDLVRVASLDESCGGETYKMVKREDKESKINLDLPMES